MTTERKKKFIVDVLFVALLLALFYVIMKYVLTWLWPFLLAALVALILQKPVNHMTQKTPLSRGVWSCIFVFLILGVLGGLVFFVGYKLSNEAVSFVNWLMSKAPEIKTMVLSISDWFENLVSELPDGLSGIVQNSPGKIVDALVSFLASFLTGFTTSTILSVPNVLLNTTITTVAACFLTKDYPKVTRFILAQCSPKGKQVILKAKSLFFENIFKMVRSYALILCITFAELFLGFSLLRMDYALILALLVALLDILPVVGTGTILLPWGVLELIFGSTFRGVFLLILYLFITIMRNVLEPKIIGKQVGLAPVVTLMSMFIGLHLFGVVGLFGLPILIIIGMKLQESGLVHLWNTIPRDEIPQDKDPLFTRAKQKIRSYWKEKQPPTDPVSKDSSSVSEHSDNP